MAGASSTLEAALEELYGKDPGEFTKARDAIAKRLKAGGDTEAAAAVRERRKPTQTAWILNQLARRHPDEVAELVDVGRELAREQRKALRGEAGASFRESIERQRKIIGKATQTAAHVMKDLGIAAGGHLEDVASALRAALVDPVIGAQLEEGRLEKAPEAAAGFAGPEMLAAASSAKALPPPKALPSNKAALAAAKKTARARAAEERAARKAAEEKAKKELAKERADKKAEARARKKALDAALAEVRVAEADAKRSHAAAEKARTDAEDAVKRAADLAQVAARSETRAAEARKALARLE